MEDYNFWQDLFDTYQSLSDWMKLAWLIVPPSFLFALIALIMRYRLDSRKVEGRVSGDLLYTVHRNDFDGYQVHQHSQHVSKEPTILLLEQNATEPVELTKPNSP